MAVATFVTCVTYKKSPEDRPADYYGEITEDVRGCDSILMELTDGGFRRFKRSKIRCIEEVRSNEEYDDARRN